MAITFSAWCRVALFSALLVFALFLRLPGAQASEVEEFLETLKSHYQSTQHIQVFSLKLHFLNRQYRDHGYWDYEEPNLYMSQRLVEVDLPGRQFFDNDILYYAGGRLSDRVQFQNAEESFFYEKNPSSLGKAVIRRDMEAFDRFKRHIVMNIDFLAVRPLLAETDVAATISLVRDEREGTTTLTHKVADGSTVDYVFTTEPLRLSSVHHGPMAGVFVYDDYQTTRGITFPRSVYKYYDGETVPTYISYNDSFDIIEEVDPGKLKLPVGFGPELERGDGVLVGEEIAKDLFLVTDSSDRINHLVSLNGDTLTLYGASGSEREARKLVAFVEERFPDIDIGAVYVTHPHGGQINGLTVFAERGVEIVADAYTVEAIKAYPRFSDSIDSFRFRTIEHGQRLGDATVYILENMHSKRQGFVHFGDSGIIFQAHFLHVPRDNSIAKIVPNYSRQFIDFIRSQPLLVNRVIGNYRNNNITPKVLAKIYDAHM